MMQRLTLLYSFAKDHLNMIEQSLCGINCAAQCTLCQARGMSRLPCFLHASAPLLSSHHTLLSCCDIEQQEQVLPKHCIHTKHTRSRTEQCRVFPALWPFPWSRHGHGRRWCNMMNPSFTVGETWFAGSLAHGSHYRTVATWSTINKQITIIVMMKEL